MWHFPDPNPSVYRMLGTRISMPGLISEQNISMMTEPSGQAQTSADADVDDVAGRDVAADIGATYHHLDVADPAAWEALVDELPSTPGQLGLVHLNAGIRLGQGDITALTDDAYHRVVGINQHGVFYGLRATVPLLEAAGGGAVVVVVSPTSPLCVVVVSPLADEHAALSSAKTTSPTIIEVILRTMPPIVSRPALWLGIGLASAHPDAQFVKNPTATSAAEE